MKIGVFGGSFNPVHYGHIGLARGVMESGLVDELWFMVSPHNPLKDKTSLADDEERLNQVREAVKDLKGVRVSDFEFHLPRPSFMYRTLQELQRAHPQHQFLLVIGADNWLCFDRWKNHDEILKNYSLIIYPRQGSEIDPRTLPQNVTYLNLPLFNISSTQIREQQRTIKSPSPRGEGRGGAIIGAGAAGCFAAILIKRLNPQLDVHVFESKSRALVKVGLTGGGRCNITNTFRDIRNLKDAYPRGDKLMKRALSAFDQRKTIEWFLQLGIRFVTQDDQCIFPRSQDAMEIVNALLAEMRRLRIKVHYGMPITDIRKEGDTFVLTDKARTLHRFHRVLVTTGGHPTADGFQMLRSLQIPIVPPAPSLFSFNLKGDDHQKLMGIVVEDVVASIPGTKFRAQGPLLFTHWGVSGPAVLKLSSYAARFLSENSYKSPLCINWFGQHKETEVREIIAEFMTTEAKKLVTSVHPTHLTQRHWAQLLCRAGIPDTQRWGVLNQKQQNRLLATLTADTYQITGRGTYKEEFVTSGGVLLKDIDPQTMQSRTCPGLFFAGEVLNIDAITGGFNLQAAWSTAYVAAQNFNI